MTRSVLVVLLAAAPAAAADPPSGSYRLTADLGGGATVTALVSFASAGGKWARQYLGSLELPAQPGPNVRDVRVNGDRLRFTLTFGGNQGLTFDGVLPTGRG